MTQGASGRDLAPFVEHCWIVRWDLSEPRTVETVRHPSIHMVQDVIRDFKRLVSRPPADYTRSIR
ncbi:MAG TPA: DUF6597 domain-containing transcriptional factor [Vicinamibacterales bacterium]